MTVTDSPPTDLGHLPTGRLFAPIVEQHASWIALNPIQGCSKSCQYCFLQDRGQTRVLPEPLVHPATAALMLIESPLYRPDSAVAVCTWTDVMAVEVSRSFLTELLRAFVSIRLPNPIVLVTKCGIPPEVVQSIVAAQNAGLRIVVYLSLSGLDTTVEQGICHRKLIRNFPILDAAGIPIVHYWRPALPSSAVTPIMTEVLGIAAKYATCTMVAGLKVESAALERLAALWPQLATTPGIVEAEGVYPQAFWDFTHHTGDRYPGYPVFHSNSCALAYALGHADQFGMYGGQICTDRNQCPDRQRELCTAMARQATPTTTEIRKVLAQYGLGDTAFEYRPERDDLLLRARVPNRIAAAIAQDLRIRVETEGQGSESYWSSGTSGARPLIIPDGDVS